MNTIEFTDAKANLASIMEKVCRDSAPITITHGNGKPVVMLSLHDYQAMVNTMDETNYLLRSPENAKQLFESIAELESGK